jgi:hypothetical protein
MHEVSQDVHKRIDVAFTDIHLTAFHVGEFDSISIAIALRNVRF